MKNRSYIIMFNKNRPKGYINSCLDDTVYEIRSLDPTYVITENISWCFLNDSNKDYKEAIEVIACNNRQNKKIKEYINLRKYQYIVFLENDKKVSDTICFNYKKSRTVGHIMFAILQAVRSKHPELRKISDNGFVIYQIKDSNTSKIN